MTRVSEIAEQWFGLCRKPPALRSASAVLMAPESAHEGLSGGGGGGLGAIRRGIGSALFGMRTLNRDRQLLWFTLLAGLVLVGNAIGHAARYYLNSTMQTSHFAAGEGPDYIFGLSSNYIVSYALDFFIAFATLFCLVLLLAGLVLSISSKKECSASFFEGLARAKKHAKAILLWSAVLAFVGMLLDRIYSFYYPVCHESSCSWINTFGPGVFSSMITQFPFNWTLDWNLLTEVPGYGGRSLLLWIYPSGFMETLQFSVIHLLLFLLTLFVVPLIVLKQNTLREAVVGSFALMKKTWVEVAACAAFLGIVVFGVFLTYLLVQAASGIVSPYETVTFHPPGTWIALAILYNLALVTIAFVVATVGGIAVLDLYNSAQSRQIPGSPEKITELR